jgi:ABC-type oligopeptide transport system ATPase subunit
MDHTATPLLAVRHMSVHYPPASPRGWQNHPPQPPAVSDLNLTLAAGETLGLVGESGSGKSTTGRAILQLLRPSAGEVIFDGVDLVGLWRRRLGRWRWGAELQAVRRHMQVVFQDPYASLNPRMTVETLVGEPLDIFGLAQGAQRRDRVVALLEQVGLDADILGRYPHAFSGGQRQRLGIARALALNPKLLIADEPISALDVSTQAQVLNLLQDLRAARGLALLFIAHDLAAVRHLCDRVAVMTAGKIVEQAPTQQLFERPRHPYTQALLAAVPRPFVRSRVPTH